VRYRTRSSTHDSPCVTFTVGPSCTSSSTHRRLGKRLAVRRDPRGHVLAKEVGRFFGHHGPGEVEISLVSDLHGGDFVPHGEPPPPKLTTFEESTTLFGTVTTRPDGWFVVTSSPLISHSVVTRKSTPITSPFASSIRTRSPTPYGCLTVMYTTRDER